MKFSESWLRELTNPNITTEKLIAQLTMAGLEVDGVEPAATFENVVVARIQSVAAHPKADKLKVCQVDCGGSESIQIVCGAPNAREGLVTAFAQVGAVLPGGINITEATLRDVASFGMLCGGDELALNDDASGIIELPDDAPLGLDLRDYLSLNDQIIEVDLTPNRGDCLSIQGLAREVGVLNQLTPDFVSIPTVDASIESELAIKLTAESACSRYVGRVIQGIDISQPSPLWMQEKLRRSGIRSIDAVVDVGNYVMLELGQPMHAFDFGALRGGIDVRFSQAAESLTLLDGTDVNLKAETLLVADQNGPLAIAGIMGGKSSAVSTETKSIFLEAAHFMPLALAGKAREYGLHTDSSHRFERGVDPQLPQVAIERATALLLDIVGGEAGPVVSVGNSSDQSPVVITLRKSRLEQQLNLTLDDALITDMLSRLGLGVKQNAEQSWICDVPSWRFDLSIEADLIEEVARIYGYDKLPVTTVNMSAEIQAAAEGSTALSDIRQVLISRDYQEAITYSFVDPELQNLITPDTLGIAVANPISADMSVMRTSLLPGLLSTTKFNLNRQQSRVRLFESGLRFVKDASGDLVQERMLAGVISGKRSAEAWTGSGDAVDFYDIKGDVEAVLAYCGVQESLVLKEGEYTAFQPGQTLVLENAKGDVVGHIGKLHPSVERALGLSQTAFAFEVVLSEITEGPIPAFSEVSKYPAVRRDISLSVSQQVAISTLLSAVKNCAGEFLVDLKIFDVYEGEHIEKGRKSIALGLTFQGKSRTLNDTEVDAAMDAVIKTLAVSHDANLRG